MTFISRVITSVVFICCFSTNLHSRIYKYGHYPDTNKIQIKDSQEKLLSTLGKPSLISAQNDKTWYYIKLEVNRNIFHTTEQSNILVLEFNENDELAKFYTINNKKKGLAKVTPLDIKKTEITYNKGLVTQILDSIKKLKPKI